MSSYKELTNSPAYNFAGENKWDIKTPSDGWDVFDGSLLTQIDHKVLFEKIGHIYDGDSGGLIYVTGSNLTGTSSNINTFLYADNTYVYVGEDGVLATSEDAYIWTPRTSGTSDNITNLAYGNNTFVYAGANGVLATSPDAVTWTARTSGTSNNINALIYANNTFVYAGDNGVLATSSNAFTWTSRTSGTSNNINALTYGNNTFVIAGDSGVLRTSTDASTWTLREIPTIIYVGGKTFVREGATSSGSTSLLNLSGGSNFAPQTNDLVVIAVATSSTAERSQAVTGYTQIASLYANDTYDTNLWVGYKVMGATPDTSVTIPASGSTSDAQTAAIQVWRNATFDIANTVTRIDSVLVNPPAITTTSNNNTLLVIGAGAHNEPSAQTYTASYLSNFLTVGSIDTNDSTIGFGSIDRPTAGTYDPAQWNFSAPSASTSSCASVTLALKPVIKTYKTLTHANNTFVVAGEAGFISTSSDATNWNVRTSNTNNDITALAYGAGFFVYGGDFVIRRSADAINWPDKNDGTPVRLVGRKTAVGSSTSQTIVSLTDLSSPDGGADTIPRTGDIVIVAVASGSIAERSQAVTGYTQIASLYANDTYDTNLWVGYKVMGGIPDTTVTIPSSGAATDAQAIAIQVVRHAVYDSANTAIITNTALPTTPALTSTTEGNHFLFFGAGGRDVNTGTYDTTIATNGNNNTYDVTIGSGGITYQKSPGTFSPSTFTGSGFSNSSLFSSAAVTILLKPKSIRNSLTYINGGYYFANDFGQYSIFSFTLYNPAIEFRLPTVTPLQIVNEYNNDAYVKL